MIKTTTGRLVKLSLLLPFLLISFETFTYSGGPPPDMTGAPGGSDCTSCHIGSPFTSGAEWDDITLTKTHLSGSTYEIRITASQPGCVRYGFEVCVLPSGANGTTASSGTFATTTPGTQIVSSGNRIYMQHDPGGTDFSGTGTAEWTFNWTKPNNYSGNVVFYLAVNATNNDGTNSGDQIYLKTFTTSVLPVSWLDAKAVRKENQVDISWNIASEVNNSHFVVERSVDLKKWLEAGIVKGAGNSKQRTTYVFHDRPSAIIPGEPPALYYRIMQVDFDGHTDHSDVFSISQDMQDLWTAYPNPFTDMLNINPEAGITGDVRIYNYAGQLIRTISFPPGSRAISTSDIPAGVYFIGVETGAGESRQKFLKQ